MREGKALLVEPTYKAGFEIPGGIVENEESPRQALKREIEEELGIKGEPGRLLVIEYQSGNDSKTESLMFIFEFRLSDDEERKISLCLDELRSWHYADAATWEEKLGVPLARRLKLAAQALASGSMQYVEDGNIMCGLPLK